MIFCGCRKAEDFIEIFLSFTQTLQGLTTRNFRAVLKSDREAAHWEVAENKKEKLYIKTKLCKQIEWIGSFEDEGEEVEEFNSKASDLPLVRHLAVKIFEVSGWDRWLSVF